MRRVAAFVLVAWLCFAPVCDATWSLVVVDTATGEVAVAAATCLDGTAFDLERLLPVILVGRGAAAAQSAIDMGAVNRKKIVAGLLAGLSPAQILENLKQGDVLKCSRQYGIVDASGASAAFTGACCGAFANHVRGTVGSLSYSIQGNVITGLPVVQAAEAALVGTTGSLADRLLAAMEAARSMGGDGRCSCNENAPTSCGAPPAGGFEKSAHIGFVVVARIGDIDGGCSGLGCATGDYWMDLSFNGKVTDPDPVLVLQQRYADFQERMRGHPDGLKSLWGWRAPVLLPNGATLLELDLELRDLLGAPILHGGAQITVEHAPGSAGLSVRRAVIDHGNGSYTLRLVAAAGAGTDVLDIGIDDGGVRATLYPYPSTTVAASLASDMSALSAATGGVLTLRLQGPDALARQAWLLHVRPSRRAHEAGRGPAGADALWISGRFDARAGADVSLRAAPGQLLPLVGLDLEFGWTTAGALEFSSLPLALPIRP